MPVVIHVHKNEDKPKLEHKHTHILTKKCRYLSILLMVIQYRMSPVGFHQSSIYYFKLIFVLSPIHSIRTNIPIHVSFNSPMQPQTFKNHSCIHVVTTYTSTILYGPFTYPSVRYIQPNIYTKPHPSIYPSNDPSIQHPFHKPQPNLHPPIYSPYNTHPHTPTLPPTSIIIKDRQTMYMVLDELLSSFKHGAVGRKGDEEIMEGFMR